MEIGCSNADVRDELFFQLMKQTTRNPLPESHGKMYVLNYKPLCLC